VADLLVGATIALLPLFLLSVPGILLLFVLPLLLLAIPVAIAALLAVPPLLLLRLIRRARQRRPRTGRAVP
jgi:hypothetical protein